MQTYGRTGIDRRGRRCQPRGWGVLAYLLTLEIPHFIMERQMLLGLKERAEAAVRDQPGPDASAASPRRLSR